MTRAGTDVRCECTLDQDAPLPIVITSLASLCLGIGLASEVFESAGVHFVYQTEGEEEGRR